MSVMIDKRYLDISTIFMELQINSDQHISEIQKDFSDVFKYLKIEFFTKPVVTEKRSAAKNIVSHQRRISELVKIPINASVAIYDGMSVLDLEKLFTDQFGLSVQVFRKSGNVWLETTMTDGWSLKQQNEHGKEITIGTVKTAAIKGSREADVD